MSEFFDVGSVEDFAVDTASVVEADDRVVVVVRLGDHFYCLDDVCTHDGGPLSDGCLSDHTIACPRHGAKFDVRTGEALTMPATQPTAVHEVRIEQGRLLVRLQT